MRLDLFLKLSRLIPKRNLAQDFAKAGMIEVNGKTSKSSYDVKVEDIIRITLRNSVKTVRVKQVPEVRQVSTKNAGELYELLAFEKSDPLND